MRIAFLLPALLLTPGCNPSIPGALPRPRLKRAVLVEQTSNYPDDCPKSCKEPNFAYCTVVALPHGRGTVCFYD